MGEAWRTGLQTALTVPDVLPETNMWSALLKLTRPGQGEGCEQVQRRFRSTVILSEAEAFFGAI